MLLKREDDLENQRVNSTTAQATNATSDNVPPTMPVMTNTTQLTGKHHSFGTSSGFSQAGTSQSVTNNLGLPGPAAQLTHNSNLHNAVISDLNVIYANSTILQSVTHILPTLEASIS